MFKKKIFIGLLLAGASVPVVYADDLKGEGEFGFTSTSGNTDSQSINAKLISGITMPGWKFYSLQIMVWIVLTVLYSLKSQNIALQKKHLLTEKSGMRKISLVVLIIKPYFQRVQGMCS